MPRQNTRLESEGAEFLVLGHLLMHGVCAFKNYNNMTGFDIMATNPAGNKQARIQVKSCWKTGAYFFLINNLDSDFVVAVRLNRGRKDGSIRATEPEYYILPIAEVKRLRIDRKTPWPKVRFKKIKEKYKNNWTLIINSLK